MKVKLFNSSFTKYGSLIATFIIVISFHLLIFIDNSIRFLTGLVTPSIIFPMLAAMVLAIPMGYILGYIPSSITELFF